MSIVRLKGQEAIAYAAENKVPLNAEEGPNNPAKSDISIGEAESIAEFNPELVWVEAAIPVKQNDPPHPPPHEG